MEQQNTQSNMTPEEAFASMGLATRLSEDFLREQGIAQQEEMEPMEDVDISFEEDIDSPPEETPEPEPKQKSEDTPEDKEIDSELKDMETRLSTKIDSMDIESELEKIRKELNLLKNEDDSKE